jgi:opacity protein-like surface antigen
MKKITNPKTLWTLLAGAVGIGMLTLGSVTAGETHTPPPQEPAATAKTEKDWSLELGSGVLFSNVRNSNLDGYTSIPISLTAAYAVDEVSLDQFAGGYLRGNTEFLFRAYSHVITHGPESRILGLYFGPRYNFVQPGWKLVPFVEGVVGFGFIDSNPQIVAGNQRGVGQDFNFTFGVSVGARYDITEDWFARAAFTYNHFSNAGLSEPQFLNRAIDNVGPELSVGTRF